jgi:ribosomal protein L20
MSDESYKHAKYRGKKEEKKEEKKGWLDRMKSAVTSKNFASKLIKAGNKKNKPGR